MTARRFLTIVPLLLMSLAVFGCGDNGNPSETCTDGAKNQNETDVDCGGVCAGCADDQRCLVDSDCTSGDCVNGTCGGEAESCDDGVENQDETDVDCGGDTCPGCADGQDCDIDADCLDNDCTAGTCGGGGASCNDGTLNQDETDVDCGGATCGPCANGSDCSLDRDCLSDSCVAGVCETGGAETCVDGLLNQDETDVDCGGVACEPCADGRACIAAADCRSNLCINNTCSADLCPDDPDKIDPGVCGCGIADTDADGDGTPDCNDGCPLDPTDNCRCYSLTWAGCPTGASVWCNDQPLDHNSSAQARIACETCFGQDCQEAAGDCAGGGWTVADPAINPTGYAFGYADGCSGVTGRIWQNGQSFNFSGYWAAPFAHPIGTDACPTGATEFYDEVPHRDPFHARQAEQACEACLGLECQLLQADCAGDGWGLEDAALNPDRITMGFEEGCTGEAGRIWAYSSSGTTYGNWAPYPADTARLGFSFSDEASLEGGRYGGITWDELNAVYYSASGGSSSGLRLARYDADGISLATYAPGLDFRAIFTDHKRRQRVQARAYNSRDVLWQNGAGSFTTLVTLNGGTLDAQSNVEWDWVRRHYVAMTAGTITRWNATGDLVDTIELQGWETDNPGEDAYPQNRGIGVSDTGLYITYHEQIASVWNEAGVRLWRINLTGAGTSFDSYFGWSYADHKIWVVDDAGAAWRSWDIGL